MRGVDPNKEAPTDDIEAQMMFRKKGASAVGMLIKDEGFEGFNAAGSPRKQ